MSILSTPPRNSWSMPLIVNLLSFAVWTYKAVKIKKIIEHFEKELLFIDYIYVPIITDRTRIDSCCPFSTSE